VLFSVRGRKLGSTEGVIFTGIEVAVGGDFFDPGFRHRRAGLWRDFQRRVVAALPCHAGIRGTRTAALRASLRARGTAALLRNRKMGHRYG